MRLRALAFLQFFFLAFEPINLGLPVGEVERLHGAVVGVAFDSFEQVRVFGGDGFDALVDPLRHLALEFTDSQLFDHFLRPPLEAAIFAQPLSKLLDPHQRYGFNTLTTVR